MKIESQKADGLVSKQTTLEHRQEILQQNKEVKKGGAKNNAQENTYIDIEIKDDNTSFIADYNKRDTRSDEEKFNAARSCVENAVKDYADIQSEIWENYPEMYNRTKGLNGFSGFYSNDCPLMSGIASGTEKPWENIKTTQEAVELMCQLLDEATHENSIYDGITSGQNINQGEYAIIQTVLGELSKINDETREVADTCAKGLQQAAGKTKSVDDILSGYDRKPVGNEGDSPATAKDILIENASSVEQGFEKVNTLRKKYEKIKSEMKNSESQNSSILIKSAYSEYQAAFENLIQASGLNFNQLSSAGGISKSYNLNIDLIKHDLEELTGGRNSNG